MTDPGTYHPLDEMKPWDDRGQLLEVIGIADEAPEVKTFTFRADARTWFRYLPGQFITLELPRTEGPLMRTFTLSSSPSRPFSIAVTVKAQPASVGTRWMFENLKSGDRIKAHGPAGRFTHCAHLAQKYLFLSGGSGITPMMSMLRWFQDCAPAMDVAFVNCAHRPEDIIFRQELELLDGRMPGLALSFMVHERPKRDSWSGHVGRIDAARLKLFAPDLSEREIFCCGPEPFMAVVRELLGAAGFDMAHYHQESFGAPVVEELLASQSVASGETTGSTTEGAAPVLFALSAIEAQCPAGRTILQTARACGVRIASACESGLCGTCKVRKLSGEVAMNHNGGILDDEIDEGFILACCSHPRGKVEIEA